MKKAWLLALIPGAIGVAISVGIGFFLLALLLIKVLWSWTIPDLFPGAVRQGLIAREITWYTALKVAVFVGIIAGGIRGKSHKEK